MKVAFTLRTSKYTEDQEFDIVCNPIRVDWPCERIPLPGEHLCMFTILGDQMPAHYDDVIDFYVHEIRWNRIGGFIMPVIDLRDDEDKYDEQGYRVDRKWK